MSDYEDEKEIDRLAKLVERLTEEAASLRADVGRLERFALTYEKTLSAAEARAERLHAALLRYGCHDGGTLDAAAKDCRCLKDGPDTCDCGLDKALARKED